MQRYTAQHASAKRSSSGSCRLADSSGGLLPLPSSSDTNPFPRPYPAQTRLKCRQAEEEEAAVAVEALCPRRTLAPSRPALPLPAPSRPRPPHQTSPPPTMDGLGLIKRGASHEQLPSLLPHPSPPRLSARAMRASHWMPPGTLHSPSVSRAERTPRPCSGSSTGCQDG